MVKEEQLQHIKDSTSYITIHYIAKWMDRNMLDPIIGFILPSVGDALTSVFVIPYLYLSIIKIKSLPLTLAIIYNMLLDVLIGIIPYIGIVGDVFKRAFSRNTSLIEGYVEGNKDVMREVDKKAIWMGILIVLLCVLIYVLALGAYRIVEWIGSLF